MPAHDTSPGRPPVDEPRDFRVAVNLTAEERERITTAAKADDRTVSAYIRRAALLHIEAES